MQRTDIDAGLADRLREAEHKIRDGFIPTWIYNDPDVYRLERERLFTRAWVYLAHESELPHDGSFVVREIADTSVLVIRGSDGEIRTFLNQCTHRGAELCQYDRGRLSRFRCNYHAWQFNDRGQLIAVPFDKEVYGGIDRAALGLIPLAQSAVRQGFVFGCMDPGVPGIDEYLGDFLWYLPYATRRSAAGLEVFGPPQRWVVDADWKIASENLIADSYHTPFAHRSIFDVGLVPFSPTDAAPGGSKTGLHIRAGAADLAMIERPAGTYMGYPPEMVDTLRSGLDDAQVRLLDHGSLSGNGTFMNRFHVFPNLSCLNVGGFVDDGRLDPYMSLRQWRPLGPGRMEIISYLLVEADAPREFKERSRRAYLVSFGSSGMAEQDDMENWRTICDAGRSVGGGRVDQYVRMNSHREADLVLADWAGPGTAYASQYFDLPVQGFLLRWLSYLLDGVNADVDLPRRVPT